MTDCDVAIVGAGVIGEAIAYELSARGASVTLLDARGAGLGSTQAAAGMLVPFIEGFGRPLLPMAARSLGMYDEFIDRLSRDTGLGVGYRRTGSLQVATADESVEALDAVAASARAAGINCQRLDARETLEAEPQLTPEVIAGLLIPDHGFVVAGDLSGALAAAARKHGARVMVPARARRISPNNGRIDVDLENDRVTARQVVVAAGAWSGQIQIDGVPSLPVRPVRGQLLQLTWSGSPLQRIAWGSRCYVVPSGPNTLLVGATVEEAGFDERATAAGVRDLLDSACDLVPHAWQATFTAARVGLRPASPDEMPIIGRSRKIPGVVYATGHFRNGILLAPLTARLVADLVLDNREDPLLVDTSPQRFGEY
ncbi:MAG: glycine oxidase ThiO [Acidobacteria bacterium]|nr:glycine oxidase ThiO [Acidobacteriota bacterium]